MGDRRHPGSGERVAVAAIALAAAVAAAWIGAVPLEGIPHVSDEVSYRFQARVLASGRAALDPPPLPDLFRVDHVVLDAERWCSKYPPGWPAILAVAVLLRVPHLANPTLLALAVVGAWRLARTLRDGRTGVVAAAALASSPFAVLMAAGSMAHTATLALALWALAALARAALAEGRTPRAALVLAGALAGAAFLVRPFTAGALLAPAFVWAVARRPRGERARAVALAASGFAPAVALLLAYHAAAFGGAWRSGYALYDPGERFSGIDGTYLSWTARLARNVPWYAARLGDGPWGWPWHDLAPFALLLWRRDRRPGAGMLAACAASLVFAHLLYYYRDVVYGGPRFAHEALGPLAVLLAIVVVRVADRLGEIRGAGARVPPSARVAVVAAALLAWPLAVRLPARTARLADAYHGQTAAPLADPAAPPAGADAIVFVAGPEFAFGTWFDADGVPPAAARPLYVRDLPALRERAVETFGRKEVRQLVLDLEALPEDDPAMRNDYPDRFRVARAEWRRGR